MEAQAATIDQPFHSAYEKFIEITSHLSAEMSGDSTPSEIEAYLETKGRELLRLLLQDHLDNPSPAPREDAVCGSDSVVRSHKGDDMETGYQSVFGAIGVARTSYSQRGVASLFPRDAQLNLPARGYSHRLQKRVAAKAAKMAFGEVVRAIETETSVRLGKAQVEQTVLDAAQDFDAFYAQPCSPQLQRQAQSKPIQVVTFDGKGVVMRTEALREATRKKAEARAQQAPRGFARKEKSNRKRLATVASLYHIDRHHRSAQTVARQFAPLRLVPTERQATPRPVGKKLWAGLNHGPWTGSMQTPRAQQPGNHPPAELLSPFGGIKSVAIERGGNGLKTHATLAQLINSGQKLGIGGQLFIAGHRANEPVLTLNATCPVQRHVNPFAVALDVYRDLLQQQANDLLPILRAGFGRRPQVRQIVG